MDSDILRHCGFLYKFYNAIYTNKIISCPKWIFIRSILLKENIYILVTFEGIW